jgi:hypothetical protein
MKTIKLSVFPFMFIAGAALLGGCIVAESGEELEGSVGEEALESLAVEAEAVLEANVVVACSEIALVNAINTANASGGGTLNLAAGCTYSITVPHGGSANGLPVITTAITLEGTGTTIQRSPGALLLFRIVEVALSGDLTVKAVTLKGGKSPVFANGGGILNHGALTLTGCTLISNIAGASGGAIYNNGTMTFTSSSVTGGGIFAVNGTMTLTSSPVTANKSSLTPGGIYRSGGTLTITTSPVTANTPTNCAGSPTPVPGCVG